jgi:hypothetical protein
MNRLPQLILALLASAAPALAQGAAPTPAAAADTSSVILANKPAESVPGQLPNPATTPRDSSSGVNAAITSGMAPYDPGVSSPKMEMAPRNRSPDKPKNEMPRLPPEMMSRYVVHGARPPVFRTRDLYTKEGLINLSFKAHPGLRFFNFFGLNNGLAYEAAINDAKMEARADLVDTAYAMAVGGDPSEGEVVQEEIINESFSAASQSGPVGGSPATR